MGIELRKFFFENLVLDVYGDAYLIKVDTDKTSRHPENQLSDLPDWAFASRNAIWLTQEEAPISVRACHGDLIRKRLSEQIHKSNSTPLSAA